LSAARVWVDAFRGRGGETALDRHLVGLRFYRSLDSATEMMRVAFTVPRVIFTPPFNWVREAVVETSNALRLVTPAMLFASLVYVLAFGSVLFGQIIYSLGAPDRVGPGIYIGLLRELGTWLTYMILAGVVGSALAGDLGARKIRDELDALNVLGVDMMRTLIVPRVVAIMVSGLMLSMIVVLVTEVGVLLLDQTTIHQPFRAQLESVFLNMNQYDLFAALLKHAILGFFIGVVACQKGLSARGGAEGVGRAVSETVVITFVGIWLINSLFNTGYLTVVPDAIGLKG
jgi:phospholipid/cholesterol/gamma-HCH transport system permease protein